jgi:putative (di)nucleoside polyphosphate hydrolase
VIDENGFRLNVGIIIVSSQGKSFWGRRRGNPTAWQFPQGGISPGESEQEAMYRELDEELGLAHKDVQILCRTDEWLFYELPSRYQRLDQQPLCIGQKQKWFLLQLISSDCRINLDHSDPPEFDQWRWVDYWYPLNEVIEFKREVYRKVLEQFEPLAQVRGSPC